MNWVTQYNKSYTKMEKNTGPSMTVPDQSLTITQILKRYAMGLPLDSPGVEIYNGEDDDMPDMTKMDKIDRIETIRRLTQEKMELEERILEDEKIKSKVREQKTYEDRFRKKYENVPSPGGGEGAGGKEKSKQSEANKD